jgi:voltage-gated potassium channel
MNSKKRIYISIIVFVLVFIIGVAGFKILGGPRWSLLDSIYMTVITLSTVGYGETIDLSGNPEARLFAVIFIILCLGTIAFAVTSITGFIVEGELKNIIGRKRMKKKISRLRDHFIVCGVDETAITMIQELIKTKRPFVVVVPENDSPDKLTEFGEILYIHGDPCEDAVLIEAGIEHAHGVLISLASDEINLFLTVTARGLNPGIRIVTKGINIKSHKKMNKAGADSVISPSYIGGMRMVSEMVRPTVVTFLDMMLREKEKGLRFEEMRIETGSVLEGKALRDSRIKEKSGALVVAVKKSGGTGYDFNPKPDLIMNADDILVLIATPDMLESLRRMGAGDKKE